MEIENLLQAGKKTERRLEEIRSRIGASRAEYVVGHVEIEITGAKLQELAEASPGKPIIIEREYCLAYIKDHIFHGTKGEHDSDVTTHPTKCFVRGNKVHFYHCKTIVQMTEKGRHNRYRATSQISTTRIIDLSDAQDVETRLAWCKYCISLLAQSGEVEQLMSKHKNHVAECADARNLMACVKACYQGQSDAKQNTHNFFAKHKR